MDANEARHRINALREEINAHNRHYYLENSPLISDYEFDLLLKELIQLEELYPQFKSPDSPTAKVGSDLETENSPFRQYAHLHPMLSLANTYSIEELRDFDARVKKGTDSAFTYNCELKFDGTGINLLYRNGILVRALTRGDGTTGDDVTRNIKTIKSIPLQLKDGSGYPEEFEIRGEVYMPFDSFNKLNTQRELDEEPLFANPRNAAAGSLKMLSSKAVSGRGLDCVLYHLIAPGYEDSLHSKSLEDAASWGLPISSHSRKCSNIDEVVEYIGEWDQRRHGLPFPTDGVVVKVDQYAIQRELGFTAKTPRWAVAYKFKPEEALTKIESIDYQVGRTGAVTPVANLSPVLLSGTTVKRATLHNADQMDLLDIRVGDCVYVEKGGEIIPKITRVELSKRPAGSSPEVFPKVCPACGTPLVRDPEQAKYFCPNSDGCTPQIEGKFLHFASRKAMDINIGEVAVHQLCEREYVRELQDLYHLDDLQLLSLDKWKGKSVENFRQSLEKSTQVPFHRVLFALGIKNIGETTAKTLATHFKNIDALKEASRDELLSVEDVGGTLADSIIGWFSEPRHLNTVQELKKAGLQFSLEEKAPVSDTLKGMTIMITGNYSIPRDTMKYYIEAHSGKVGSSVTSSTTYLVAGAKAGASKLEKARKLGIPVISEEEFYKIAAPGQENDSPETDTELKLF